MLRTALKDIVYLVNKPVAKRSRQTKKYGIRIENTHFRLHAEKLAAIFQGGAGI
jgi:hypothetical protein